MHMQWKEHLPPIEVPVKILCHLGPGNQSWFECHYTFLILKDISEKTPQRAFCWDLQKKYSRFESST